MRRLACRSVTVQHTIGEQNKATGLALLGLKLQKVPNNAAQSNPNQPSRNKRHSFRTLVWNCTLGLLSGCQTLLHALKLLAPISLYRKLYNYMAHLGLELHLGRLEGVVGREVDGHKKHAARVRGVAGTHDGRLPAQRRRVGTEAGAFDEDGGMKHAQRATTDGEQRAAACE